MNKDICDVRGALRIWQYDEDGNLKQKLQFKNLVVTAGLNYIAGRVASGAGASMSHMALGTSNTAPALGQTALIAEVGRVALTSTVVAASTITYTATFGPGVATGTLNETGIFNDPTVGTMQNRAIFPIAIPKLAGDTIVVTWTVTFS